MSVVSHHLDPQQSHVRRPDLPWRPASSTDCGLQLSEVAGPVEDRDQLLARIEADGLDRVAYSRTCIPCLEARRHPTWSCDPVRALAREFAGRPNPALGTELRAIAALIAAHREEFAAYVDGLAATVDLTEARQDRRLLPARRRAGSHLRRV